MKQWNYILNLVRFAFRHNALLYAGLTISIFSVGVELLAMSSLLPLFELVSSAKAANDGIITHALVRAGFGVTATTLLWTFILLFALRIATQVAGQSLSLYLGKRVMAQLGSRAFEQIVKQLSIREINDKSIGFYIGLAGDESFRASMLVISLTQFVSTAALAVFYYAAIALYSAVTAGLVMAFLLCSLAGLYWVLRLSHRLGERQTVESRKAHSVFLDSLNNLKAIRSISAEGYVVDLYRSIIFGYTRILFLIDEIAVLTRLLPVLLLLALFGAWLAWSAQSIESAGIAFIVTMIVYLMRFFPAVGQGVNLLMRIASDAKSGEDVTAIVATTTTSRVTRPEAFGRVDRIDLEKIRFSYATSAGKEIFGGVNLTLARGRSYALAGKSGAGKSTLMDLLLKFYAPDSGYLLLNNTPIADVADSEIRRRVILIGQEAAIFDDSVINNIRMGMEASVAEIHEACRKAHIHDVIEEMAQGYQTRLQYQGKNLSGGQRQRIAIARALLRKPDVLILDESTSALDKPTQQRVIDNILEEYAEKMVIFVTHDPYIMERVSEVVDLDKINPVVASLDLAGKQPG